MFAEERQEKIRKLVNEKGRVLVNELCEIFNASAVTIRRDLLLLEKKGAIKRTHGGAITQKTLYSGLAFTEKEKIKINEKERIGSYAAGLVQQGDVIIIDPGSTTLKFVQNLKGMKDITVITNSLRVAIELAKSEIKIILTGGEMNSDHFSLFGPLANNILQSLSADKLFMGVDGIDLKAGLTTPNIFEAKTICEMMECACEKILLTDSSKFGRRSLAVINKVSSLDKIITDDGLDKEEVEKYQSKGVEVILV